MRARPRIKAGNYHLSIQAGDYLYSTPRTNGLPLDEYENVEVAIFKGDDWVHPEHIGFEEGIQYWEPSDMSNYVGAYVPQDVVARLQEYLEALDGDYLR